MKLKPLKEEVFSAWKMDLSGTHLDGLWFKMFDEFVEQGEDDPCGQTDQAFHERFFHAADFRNEVKRSGDLRCKQTWIDAWLTFTTRNILRTSMGSESFQVVSWLACPPQNFSELWHQYRHRILDGVLASPKGLDLIRNGLQRLYYEAGEQETALQFLKELTRYEEFHLELPTLALPSAA